jgi:hypothetical protein
MKAGPTISEISSEVMNAPIDLKVTYLNTLKTMLYRARGKRRW